VSIKHIIWDWNGTLFGDSRALIDSTIDAFTAAGLPPITREQYQAHHTQPIPLFYERLAGRTLTRAEQESLNDHFQTAYLSRRPHLELEPGAREALELWHRAGGRQSLLSMHPHRRLVPLVREKRIGHLFTLVQGWTGGDPDDKTPHLVRHLAELGLAPEEVQLVGDSAGDARAARSCGVACVLYHASERALHARDHFTSLEVTVSESLNEIVAALMPYPKAAQPSRDGESGPSPRTGPPGKWSQPPSETTHVGRLQVQ
jgi:phosphoglycolate phosphatase-like HAD superfamily hydrolase